jgi:hypothetical protein
MKCLKNSNDSIDNLVVMLMDKNRKQKQLGLYLLKSSPELIEPVAKKLLSKFEVERKYNTIDELVNDESVKEEKDRYPLFHQDENYKFFSVEFFRFELNNIFIAFSFSVSLSDFDFPTDSYLNKLANGFSNKILPTLLITIEPKRFLYVSKNIKTNSKKLLDDIYNLIEKSWNPIIKSKSLLNQVILEIEDAISELK